MSSSYIGLYVNRYSNGQIHEVGVAAGVNSILLSPETYLEREIQPPMESLPDFNQYLKQQEQAR